MKVRDRVWLKDPLGEHFGTVTTVNEHSGMCTVKWDSGMTERIHKTELTVVSDTEGDTDATQA